MKIVVAGGAAFEAAALCRAVLAERDARVVCLWRSNAAEPGDAELFAGVASSPRFAAFQVDHGDSAAIADILKFEQPNALVETSWPVAAPKSRENSGEREATQLFLDAAHAYWSELPRARKNAFRYVHAWSGPRVAGRDHGAAEPLLAACFASDGFPVVSVRCTAAYGPGQSPNSKLADWITSAILARELKVSDLGMSRTAWLHVEDMARGLLLAAQSGERGRRYELAPTSDASDLELVHRLCEIADAKCPRSDGAPHVAAITVEDATIFAELDGRPDAPPLAPLTGWRPIGSLWEGLEATFDWYAQQSAWWLPQKLKSAAEAGFSDISATAEPSRSGKVQAGRRRGHGAKV
ncbi:MAG: NAD-dependent epimerase/dehydratase family protein [Hyphomicrobium sp.]